MVSPEISHLYSSSSGKYGGGRSRTAVCFSDGCLFLGGACMAFLLVWSFSSFYRSPLNFEPSQVQRQAGECGVEMKGINRRIDPPSPTFYDDPDLSYTVDSTIEKWDEKRRAWLDYHPSFRVGMETRIVMITGSQPGPCQNPIGDHLLLRFFKNKVDYCRIHGIEIFYSNAFLQPKMRSYWAKLPIVKAAMLAHPEAEWIWWVDSDAVFTDMDFELPLKRYRHHNMVVHGWKHVIYEKRSWTALNAGVFLIRNCQWSMDLINVWSQMGPMSPDYEKWGQTQRSIFTDKLFPESDDQTGLLYLLYTQKEKYLNKIYLEGEYYFQGYWEPIIGSYENVSERYLGVERGDATLRRRHAEAVSEKYGEYREEKHLKGERGWVVGRRRPFVTHFTGCQPCSGDHNKRYKGETCWNGMIMALNFADNQVMRNYGYVHSHLLQTSPLKPVPFDYPDEGPW